MFGRAFFGGAYFAPRYWGSTTGIAPPADEPSNRYGHRRREEDLTRTVQKQWEVLEARKRAREQPEIVVRQPTPQPVPIPQPSPELRPELSWNNAPELDAVLARVAPGLREEFAFKAAANDRRLVDLVAILAAADVFDDE